MSIIQVLKNFIKKESTGRPLKYKIEEKLETIVFVLKSGISWKELNELNKLYDESSYRKYFYQLVKSEIIKKIFESLKPTNPSKINFIDSSQIRNKHGEKSSIGFCPQDMKHKGNKVSLVINNIGKPIGCEIGRGSDHDLKLLDATINNLNIKILVGDKSYTSKKKRDELKKNGIKLLYPVKRNIKELRTKEERKLLKRRHLVENSFANLKKFKRLGYRYERKLEYFKGFVLLGLITMMIR
ncbi:MAG: IS5 family transposase [Lutibacter sp.]|nr:IS5 family transposase [Lutibacter sp.]